MFRNSNCLCRSYVKLFYQAAKRLTSRFPEAYKICKEFRIPKWKMVEIVDRMSKEIELGLARDTHNESTVKCFVSFVQDLPTGNERGKFLGLDLGGTHFRCLLVNLTGDPKTIETKFKSFVIEKPLMHGPGQDLFKFIAKCLAGFCKEQGIQETEVPLGFTFSFPLEQTAINKGILTTWTKGFKCSGVVGHDVVELLQKEIDLRGDINVKIVALINDSTGTLVSCAKSHKDCRIGLIVGTGCNACYVEKTSNAQMLEGYETNPKPFMLINTEMGAFGQNGTLDFILTSYDKAIDLQTVNPTKQIFEKCTSGMFLGEVVRHILVDLMRMGVLFPGQASAVIEEPWHFKSRYLTEIMSEPSGFYYNSSMILDHLSIITDNEHELACVHYVCESILLRSVQLACCCLVALVKKIDVEHCTIGIDGAVARNDPNYMRLLESFMVDLLQNSKKIKLVPTKDGSGIGAALVAAACVQNAVSK